MYKIYTHGVIFTTVDSLKAAKKIVFNLIVNDVIGEVTIKKV